MDLSKLNESQLQTILHFTESLVERQTADGGINFDEPDLEQAELQAIQFVERRKVGYRNAEIEGDAEIREGVREWMKRTNRTRNL
jgi:hypothetical protein